MRRTTTALAGAAVLAGLLAGCSSSPEPQDVTVGLVDYAFTDLPDELAAGSVLSVDNQSDDELHELVAIRLPDDEERSGEERAAARGARCVLRCGADRPGRPAAARSSLRWGTAPSPTSAGTSSSVRSRPVPTRASTSRPPRRRRTVPPRASPPPHFVNGMWTELTVVE